MTDKTTTAAPQAATTASASGEPDRAAFEEQARYQGATNFMPADKTGACWNGWSPATYLDPATELAWRVWANKRAPAPSREAAPLDQREKFETEWRMLTRPHEYDFRTDARGDYCDPELFTAWRMWQTALAQQGAGQAAQAGAGEAGLVGAVRKLIKAKGRFHTEQNYKALTDALAKYDAAMSAATASQKGEQA